VVGFSALHDDGGRSDENRQADQGAEAVQFAGWGAASDHDVSNECTQHISLPRRKIREL
jgi:hypothetical protein